MRRKNWNKVAEEEFNAMPKSFQEDWYDLRERTAN
jgi:hypothetical protein